jgi:TRAP-type C4-dicarboxylate transport system substrate-binding protein
MTEIPVMDGIGGLLVSRQFFDKLPADLQQLLRRTGEEAGKRLLVETRRDNAKSLQVLKQHGITFTNEWRDSDAVLYDLRDRAAAARARNLTPTARAKASSDRTGRALRPQPHLDRQA